jgi:hypothetical protein
MLIAPKEHAMHHHGHFIDIERMRGMTPHLTRQMESVSRRDRRRRRADSLQPMRGVVAEFSGSPEMRQRPALDVAVWESRPSASDQQRQRKWIASSEVYWEPLTRQSIRLAAWNGGNNDDAASSTWSDVYCAV